jgi:hypothetical protein
MFIRPTYIKSKGKRLAYWSLVESYRTAKGPRQRIIAYLGKIEEAKRKGVKQAAEGNKPNWIQAQLFDNDNTLEAEWVEIDANGVRVENEKAFGGPWLAKSSGLGDEPRRVLNELSKVNLVDVVMPTSVGMEIRKRCVTRPTEHQEILLQYLGLKIPLQFVKK